jgi:homogentisate 1,2-dioxygenase
VRFSVELPDGEARGYICENFGALLRLPDLGPIGSNGLANPRDFLTPHARYEDVEGDFELVAKFQGNLWRADRPFAARRGRLARQLRALQVRPAPLQHHRLDQLRPSGSVDLPGAAFAQRHRGRGQPRLRDLPAALAGCEDTFRPPWFHRNVASEFMGLIHGAYDAKAEGFVPGGASLHNCMSGHGPDAATFDKASSADTTRRKK